MPTTCVATLNRLLESGADLPSPAALWDRWLWGCDAAEPGTPQCLLNEMHLLGLLIARYRALREPGLRDFVLPTTHHLKSSRVGALSPRQLKDAVDDLQMHWERYLEEDQLADVVDALMARFGELNLGPIARCDDLSMVETGRPDRLSETTIRRFVSVFYVLYRHLHMLHHSSAPAPPSLAAAASIPEIQEFHVQAAMETFQRYTMHADLPPAARLLYRQDFAGFYNCVSQAVYFHFPSYERKVQLPLEDLRARQPPMYMLAPLMEMYPEIPLRYEDERIDGASWSWVLMGARVYLARGVGEIYSTEGGLLAAAAVAVVRVEEGAEDVADAGADVAGARDELGDG